METQAAASNRLALFALAAGAISLALFFAFYLAETTNLVMLAAIALGIVGIVLSVQALRRQQSKALAVTGLVLSLLTTLAGIGLFAFALLFLGVLTGNPV